MNGKTGIKRPLTLPKGNIPITRAGRVDGGLWSEKHAPSSTQELEVCIHKGTIDKVREWMELSISPSKNMSNHRFVSNSSNSSFKMPPPPRKRLLILCGQPGTGEQDKDKKKKTVFFFSSLFIFIFFK
jgi:hypothetical protein